MIAHVILGLPIVELSLKARTGAVQWFSEWIAASGLTVVILAGIRFEKKAAP